ncbi:MAG TPA: hypothetical protein PLE96_01240 [bacterium]|nr:hypothetical protein [Candidatus Woesebacteria bacterium]HOG37506.1 hypothetical protein [Candidatus Woesebacteria bacterium]HPL01557.1 hypothetical protein [bacterium]
MKENIKIWICPPDQRLVSPVREPVTDEEKINFQKLNDSGAVKLLSDMRDNQVVYQRKSESGEGKDGKTIKYEPAVVNVGRDFRSVGILFDGVTSSRYEDGSFVRFDLAEDDEFLSLSYDVSGIRKIDKRIRTADLADEMFKILLDRQAEIDIRKAKNLGSGTTTS